MGVYEKPGVRTVRESELGHPIMAGAGLSVGIIGKTDGAKTTIVNSVSTRGAGNTDNIMTLDSPPVEAANVSSISKISDTLGGSLDYIQGTGKDYTLGTNQVIWNPTSFLRVVLMVEPVSRTTGGSLAAGTYYWVVVAYNGNGQTTQSNEVKVTTTGDTSSVQLRWEPIDLATGYRVFRSTTSGVYTDTLVADIVGGNNSDYIDTGVAAGVGTPLEANTALRRPVMGARYYVDYTYQVFSYNPKQYYGLQGVYEDHGMNSNLGIAAKLALALPPEGNGATSLWLVAAKTEIASSYIEALNKFETHRVDLIVSLMPIDVQLLAYCKNQSTPENKNECRMFTGPYKNTPLGNESTPNTIIYNARALDDRRALYVDNWGYVDVKNEDGSYTNIVVDGTYLAAALAGRRSGLRDSAEPLTNKPLFGFTQLGVTRLGREMDMAASKGVCVVWSDRGKILLRHCITTDISVVEGQEENIVGAEDELRRALRSATNQPGRFIGRKLTIESLMAIELTSEVVLSSLIGNTVISEYQNLVATQNSLEPRQVDVNFEYKPMYAINWIVFRYSFII